jgi:hypothetical protein
MILAVLISIPEWVLILGKDKRAIISVGDPQSASSAARHSKGRVDADIEK